ncbi:hypothetical protein [Amygdalobacter nucleatus]|uniref:hypothetical protein n=1 Tax=Amygdalobacter nucleatus TaxID=3029274 RepID=UPI00279F1C49|nr:hypothetical protein [Amygdalobacter nucleatus]WEG37344.1 hypothetical protein PYS63_02580 [Amygdalobacter nucleatus]
MTMPSEQAELRTFNLDAILASSAQAKFSAFRESGLIFRYARFAYKVEELETEIELKVVYDFEIAPLFKFAPSFSLRLPASKALRDKLADRQKLEALLFQIGCMESLSYWKCFCPKYYIMDITSLKAEAKAVWLDWFYNGLGEMLYRNQINCHKAELLTFLGKENKLTATISSFTGETVQALNELMAKTSFKEKIDVSWQIVDSLSKASILPIESRKEQQAVLIPVGGGKDSVVSLELLRKAPYKRYGFAINPSQACLDSLKLADVKKADCFFIKRNLDRRIVDLNKLGFLNGHTPFSGIVAFYSYLVAYLTDIPYIALSNEASSNAATVKGSEINHQYSKTSQFEASFQTYAQTYLGNCAYYFSFLRVFNELAIARIFAKFPAYYTFFRSCNLGSRQGENMWCGECAKCLFVYLILSPYITKERLEAIFNANLLKNKALLPDLAGLLGVTEVKPFECVGTVNEVSYVMAILLNQAKAEEDCLLKEAKNWVMQGRCPFIKYQAGSYIYLGEDPLEWQEAKLIPAEFKQILQTNYAEIMGD